MSLKSPVAYHNHWGTFVSAANLPNVAASPTQDVALEAGDTAYVTAGASTYQCTASGLGAAVWTDVTNDPDAIHQSVAGEIAGIGLKGAPTVSDLLVIEDAAVGNAKKRIAIGTLPTGLDPAAIHDNVANEISGIAPKAAPIAADLIIIEDSALGNIKKSVQIGNLPGGGGGASAGSYVDIGGPYQYTQPAVPVEETMGDGTFDGSLVSTLTAYFRASVTNVWTTTGTTRVRLYDMGPAAGPPGVPRLVTELTATAQGGPREVLQALSVVAAAPGTNDILNTARMYEVVVIQDSSTVGDSAYLSGGLDVR